MTLAYIGSDAFLGIRFSAMKSRPEGVEICIIPDSSTKHPSVAQFSGSMIP